jgi:hypothetical protein
MNESYFSKQFCRCASVNFKCLAQRLEVTTGAGVPDLSLLIDGKTYWIELKWQTKHIRPEQYVWGKKAEQANVAISYLVGSKETIDLYNINNAQMMTNSFKLTNLLYTVPRSTKGIQELIQSKFI